MEVTAFRDAAECSHMLSQYGWRWGSQDSPQRAGGRGERWMTNVAFFAESGRNSDIWPV